MPGDWTDQEVALIVVDYFEMLAHDLRGDPYNKAEHNRRLLPRLNGRSRGSVEFKHCNLSAVMIRLGLPYIAGYQPRSNYQSRLVEAVQQYVEANLASIGALADAPKLNPESTATVTDHTIDTCFDSVPDEILLPPDPDQPWLSRRAQRINFIEREAANRRLGRLGEQFVVDLERCRLTRAGRDDLASRVEWVADTCGDGLGFDVLSYHEADDRERYLEVKTTTQGKHFPFYITRNEVRCSQSEPQAFRLYRLFDFGQRPRLYVIDGDVSQRLRLDPIQYRAAT